MFLVDATGHVVHAKCRGHVMLNAADVLSASGLRLAANDPQADQILADTLRRR